jgi:hypothetical protein
MKKTNKRKELIVKALNSDPLYRYTVGALAHATGCQGYRLSAAIQALLNARQIKQTEFSYGNRFTYAYSVNEAADDALVMLATMRVVIEKYDPRSENGQG